MKNRIFSQDKALDLTMEATFSQTNCTHDQSLFDADPSADKTKRGAENPKVADWLSKTIHIVDPMMNKFVPNSAFMGDIDSRDTS